MNKLLSQLFFNIAASHFIRKEFKFCYNCDFDFDVKKSRRGCSTLYKRTTLRRVPQRSVLGLIFII